ncbi:MAG: tetratricopeptide repeat protein [Elusimicrobia bacterium]|nr:tetratricopeptide repeat protein [Elusimicrobiota bacterium]
MALSLAGCAADRVLRRQLTAADRAIHHARFAEAERALEAAELAGLKLWDGDPRRAELWRLKGDVALLQNQPAKALPLYEKVHAAAVKAYGPASPEAAAARLDLAELRAAKGETRAAEALFRSALSDSEKPGAGRGGDLATRLSDLAMASQAEGKLAEAERLYRRSLEATERQFGPSHPLVAARLNDLGLVLQSQRRDAHAEKAYRRALAIREKALPAGHPDLDATLNDLALFLESRGLYADAEKLYRRALELAEQGKAPRSAARPNYASLLRRLGREAEAAALESGSPSKGKP